MPPIEQIYATIASSELSNYFENAYLVVLSATTLLVSMVLLKTISIKELIRNCISNRSGREVAWQEFKSRFDKLIQVFIYREFRHRCGDREVQRSKETLLDLSQDVYIRLLKDNAAALKRFRGETDQSFIAFLYVTCRNIVSNYIRNKYGRESRVTSFTRKKGHNDSETVEIEPLSLDTLNNIARSELIGHVTDLLRDNYQSRAIDRDITIFKLYYIHGFTSKELVELYDFGLSSSGIETLMSRMKQSLKNTE